MSHNYSPVVTLVLVLVAHSAATEPEPRLIGWLGETHSVVSTSKVTSLSSQSTLPELPLVGYGTAALGAETEIHVAEALQAGYRLLDSAQAREWYREDLVAAAVRSSGIRREQLFITSKLHPRNHGRKTARKSFLDSLEAFNTSYIDLFLLHYPQCWGSLCGNKPAEGSWEDSWAALEELVDEGAIRFIGVSNFNVDQFDKLTKIARRRPFLLQWKTLGRLPSVAVFDAPIERSTVSGIEACALPLFAEAQISKNLAYSDPLRQNRRLFEHVIAAGVKFQAYSSLGSQWRKPVNPVLTHPTIVHLSNKYNVSTAQVVLQWAMQNGQYVVPRSSKVSHMRDNLMVAKQVWKLSNSDLLSINALDNTVS